MIPRKPRPAVELAPRSMRVVRQPCQGNRRVVIGITTRVPLDGDVLDRCLQSVAQQTLRDFGVVLLLDGVDAERYIGDVAIPEELSDRTWVLTARCGTAARARNAILDFVDDAIPEAQWVARLDVDDTFAEPTSLEAAVALGDESIALAVLGGNRVLSRDGAFLRNNCATASLCEPQTLLTLVEEMAHGTAPNELPSCNLLLRTRSGLRYPDIHSGEDHWLVASLLFFKGDKIAILPTPLFVDYRLDGAVTCRARAVERHQRSRNALRDALHMWTYVADLPGEILGFGQEGVIRRHQGKVFKHFYPRVLSSETVQCLSKTLVRTTVAPRTSFEWDAGRSSWIATYSYEQTSPFETPDKNAVTDFLRRCLDEEVVCANVKFSNFRVRDDGSLVYIDIGNFLIPMDVSYFRDAAARLYSIGVLGASDEELRRRKSDPSQPEVWETLPGFVDFYGGLVGGWMRSLLKSAPLSFPKRSKTAPEVTLLLKACAMDAWDIRAQVIHVVDQLSHPRTFARRVLLVDPFPGPFLRQHTPGDLNHVVGEAKNLVSEGWIDEVWIGPGDSEEIRRINKRWFGVPAGHTHSVDGVPVTPQVWAFDRITTRFVLQGDIDVLVGRSDFDHDYLAEMVAACASEDVVGVAFNIPHPPGSRPYAAPPGEYKPEVRLGLLDLQRLRALLPLPAKERDGRLTTTWYRSLHMVQRQRGLRTVRGGNAATFYVHPPNHRKHDKKALARIRDLVAQGRVPPGQVGRWDLESPAEEWSYRRRTESVVVLALGRNTPEWKVRRFARGLAIQDWQDFGVIVVDDASDTGSPSRFIRALRWLGERLTLVRRAQRYGRVANLRLGIGELCVDPDTMIVTVDLDDALAHPAAIREVSEAGSRGHDVVLAAPFRPDVPVKVYTPDFSRPRQTYGGDVWIHLRAYRKRLFDTLPPAALELDGRPIDAQVDYATMIPIVERARSPIYLPKYRYWHERSTLLDEVGRRTRDRTILRILAKGREGENP